MSLVEDDFSTIHIASKKKVQLEFSTPELEVQYPKEWFDANKGEKPFVGIPKCSITEDEIFDAVKGGIAQGDLNIKTAKIFIKNELAKMREVSKLAWTTFGLQLAAANQSITPLSLIKIIEKEEHTPTETTSPSGEGWTRTATLFFVLSLYRICRVTNPDYRDILEKRLREQVHALGGLGIQYGGSANLYSAWSRDNDYNKLIAALDMFLYKFKSSEFAIFRMATLGSRFRDCAGLVSFGYARGILGANPKSLIEWIFVQAIGDEIVRMTKPGQEVSKDDSYFPYQSDFKLVERSAYSSVSNPHFFHWVHIIGALLGNKRSINARYTFEGCTSDVTINAALLVWAYSHGAELIPQFSTNGEPHEASATSKEGEDIDTLTSDNVWMSLVTRNPSTWFGIFNSSGSKLPKCIIKMLERQQEKIRDPRPNTIGEYVKYQLTY